MSTLSKKNKNKMESEVVGSYVREKDIHICPTMKLTYHNPLAETFASRSTSTSTAWTTEAIRTTNA
jgi:hypothetical protein